MSFFDNTCKPTGLGGKLMAAMMKLGHRPLADWSLRYLALATDAGVLDCGCGGGANIKKLLKKCPRGVVKGIDYFAVSVEKARKLNTTASGKERNNELRGNAHGGLDAICALVSAASYHRVRL